MIKLFLTLFLSTNLFANGNLGLVSCVPQLDSSKIYPGDKMSLLVYNCKYVKDERLKCRLVGGGEIEVVGQNGFPYMEAIYLGKINNVHVFRQN